MNQEQKMERIRSLHRLSKDLEAELKTAQSNVRRLKEEIRKTEVERDKLITSTEFQTSFTEE